jgi:two-component system, NarL family, sensor histidine kinase UhpB
MPMRFRLIALVAVALMIGLALGAAVTLFNSSRSVRAEMASALLVAKQSIDNVIRGIDHSPDPRRELDDLVDSFKGSRHLRVSSTAADAAAEVRPVSDRAPFGKVPKWFVRLIGVPPEAYRVPVTVAGRPFGTVIAETDPHNEILEVWDELSGSLVTLAVFAGATIPLIYLLIGRALRPLDRLAAAMEQVGHGDYAIRVGGPLTPELARLRDSFNGMAGRLAAADSDNRRLHEQLLTLQEEERNDIARDLHDEIGPFLFALNVDIAHMARLLNAGRVTELPPHVQGMAESARYLQRHIRDMLGRLRSIGLAEFGLADALGGLVEFWQRHSPEIEYRVMVAPACDDPGEPAGTTIYRIVQEALSNAVRHGRPRIVTVSVERDVAQGQTIVEISDDGSGFAAEPAMGYGLTGMKERVRAIAGSLAIADRPGGGCIVRAALPYSATPLGSPAAREATQ